MSDYRVTCGMMAELAFPVPDEKYEETINKLYETETKLCINYDGTLIYSEDVDIVLYDFDIQLGETCTSEDFSERCNNVGLPIVGSPKSFSTVWYDGADSTQSMMTVEEFQRK